MLALFLLFVALWFAHCFLFFSICVVMLALWSPSSIATHFTSCVVILAFGHFQQLLILLSVLQIVMKSGIGAQGEESQL